MMGVVFWRSTAACSPWLGCHDDCDQEGVSEWGGYWCVEFIQQQQQTRGDICWIDRMLDIGSRKGCRIVDLVRISL